MFQEFKQQFYDGISAFINRLLKMQTKLKLPLDSPIRMLISSYILVDFTN